MLLFADSAWHVFSIFIIFSAGLLLAIAQYRIFNVNKKLALIFYIWHTLLCLIYFQYSLSTPADAKSYYLISIEGNIDFRFGTKAIEILTSIFSAGLDLSYGGTFLVFNIIGFIGMIAFASVLQDLTKNTGKLYKYSALLVLFMPGLSFWSSAIGKDALTFTGASLATWGVLKISRRYPALIFASLLFLFARPHMAGILLVSITLSLTFASRMSALKKTALITLSLPAAVFGVIYGIQFAGIREANSISDFTEYVEKRQGYNMEGGGSVDIANMSMAMRLITYLYRPFIFEGSGLMGSAVGLENLLIAIITLSALGLIMIGRRPQIDTFPTLFYLLFSAAALFVLANTTANLGIAIRQKWMFMPMLLALAFSIIRQRQHR